MRGRLRAALGSVAAQLRVRVPSQVETFFFASSSVNQTEVTALVSVKKATPSFPFTGHKDSFFGDLHAMGKDGVAFFTETKAVTSVWFTEEDAKKKVSTWDGTLTRN